MLPYRIPERSCSRREDAAHVSAAIDELKSELEDQTKAIAQFKTELSALPESAAFTGDAKILLGAITDRANQLFP